MEAKKTVVIISTGKNKLGSLEFAAIMPDGKRFSVFLHKEVNEVIKEIFKIKSLKWLKMEVNFYPQNTLEKDYYKNRRKLNRFYRERNSSDEKALGLNVIYSVTTPRYRIIRLCSEELIRIAGFIPSLITIKQIRKREQI